MSATDNRTNQSPYGELKYVKQTPKHDKDQEKFAQHQMSRLEKTELILKTFPLGIAGVALAVFALGNGIRHFINGNSQQQQNMMRLRVGAQAFAVVCIIGQMYIINRDFNTSVDDDIDFGDD